MVDSTIQSLVQSPYMRTLAAIPAKSENLVHGITDNTPPFSRQRVYLQPVSGQNTLNGPFRFEIPRMGLLDRMQLRVRVKHEYTSTSDLDPSTGALGGSDKFETHSYFANDISSIELYSKQRFLERLDPHAIHWEELRHTSSVNQWYTHSYADIDAFGATRLAGTTVIPLPDRMHTGVNQVFLSAGDGDQLYPEFVFPLPFCSLSTLKKNFQTYFVENLSVLVNVLPDPVYHFLFTGAGASRKYYMELVCDYHQYHPNVETVIRNANYKQGIPATIPWYDWMRFDRKLVGSNVAGQVTKAFTYSLESDALISELLIVPTFYNSAISSRAVSAQVLQDYYVVITSNSEVLYKTSFAEAVSNLGRDRMLNESHRIQSHTGALTDEKNNAYIPIVLGLYKSDEHFSGGLSLASLNDARISIYPNRSVYEGTSSSAYYQHDWITSNNFELDFIIIGKRHFLLRIDSDTGVVSRTIES